MAQNSYTPQQRGIETFSLLFYAFLQLYSFCILASRFESGLKIILPAFLGYLGADFISGFLHWAADTWGNPSWPIFGNSLIRTFREHHIHPEAITKHDFVETNGAISLIAVPLLLFANLVAIKWSFFLFTMITIQCFFGAFTSQIHKWSHLPNEKTSGLVKFFQNTRIILSPKTHSTHHCLPFDKYYCINSGSLNWFFYQTGFFRVLEKIISTFTGAKPREDDLKNWLRQKSADQAAVQSNDILRM